MYIRPTLEAIYLRIKADMESRLTGEVQIPRFSLLAIQSIVFAGAAHLQYGFISWIAKQVFPDLATEWGLTRWGNILNLPRKAATYTTGTVLFTGTIGKLIPAGTLFIGDENGLEYATDAAVTIGGGGSISATATAQGEGTDYNTTEDFTLSSPDPDIDTVITNSSGFDDGEDQESLALWKDRILQRFQNPPSSGTVADYERWALEVSGVSYAWGFGAENWAGAGTCGVGVADADHNAVSGSVLTAVEDYIDTVKPEPANVSVFNVVPTPTVYAISITPNTSEIQAAIVTNLTNMHLAEASPGGTLLLSSMRRAIGSVPVTDYEITNIDYDGASIGVANVVSAGQDIAQYSTTAFSTL